MVFLWSKCGTCETILPVKSLKKSYIHCPSCKSINIVSNLQRSITYSSLGLIFILNFLILSYFDLLISGKNYFIIIPLIIICYPLNYLIFRFSELLVIWEKNEWSIYVIRRFKKPMRDYLKWFPIYKNNFS